MAFITAATVHHIFDLIKNDFVYEQVLRSYFTNKSERDDFRNSLWLYFFEHPEPTIKSYNQKYFKYYYISVIKNQVTSNTKKWIDKYSINKPILMEHLPEIPEEQEPFLEEELSEEIRLKNYKVELVKKAIDHYLNIDPKNKPEMDMFKMYYIDKLTMRQISKKMYNIPLTDVYRYIKSAEERIKWYIKKRNIKL
jgi:RNA polymerase sigma factor (sigma-70 family)